MPQPQIIIMAGPNGAGKSTSAPALVPESVPYINADEIAKVLASEGTEKNKDMEASRLLLRQWDRFESERADFAIETTMASRSLAPKIRRLQDNGYQFLLYFFWLPSADLAVARVAERVRNGGHHIPEDVIRRRYEAGIRNFFEIYQPLADQWKLFANTEPRTPVLVAEGRRAEVSAVSDVVRWTQINREKIMNETRVRETPAVYASPSREMEKAVQRAVLAAVLEHKRAGNPIAIWRDGKVVIVPPEEIDVSEDEDSLTVAPSNGR